MTRWGGSVLWKHGPLEKARIWGLMIEAFPDIPIEQEKGDRN